MLAMSTDSSDPMSTPTSIVVVTLSASMPWVSGFSSRRIETRSLEPALTLTLDGQRTGLPGQLLHAKPTRTMHGGPATRSSRRIDALQASHADSSIGTHRWCTRRRSCASAHGHTLHRPIPGRPAESSMTSNGASRLSSSGRRQCASTMPKARKVSSTASWRSLSRDAVLTRQRP